MTGFVPPGPGQPPEDPAGSPPQQPPHAWPPQYPGQPPYGAAPDSFRNRAEEATRAGTSRKLAGWALGLSLVLCLHPLTLLVSAGLAIAALARSGGQPEHGRRMAIAALVIDALWVVVVIIVVATGVVGEFTEDAERDEDGRVTERSDISAFKLRVGDCVNDPAFTAGQDGAQVLQVEAVPCSEPHDIEVYHAFDLPDGDHPGNEAVFAAADRGCTEALRAYTGRIPRGSGLLISYYAPQEQAWRLLDDHEVTCIIGDPDKKTVGSLKRR